MPRLPHPRPGTAQVLWVPGPGPARPPAAAALWVYTARGGGSGRGLAPPSGAQARAGAAARTRERAGPRTHLALELSPAAVRASPGAGLICKMKSWYESSPGSFRRQLLGLERTSRPLGERHRKPYTSWLHAPSPSPRTFPPTPLGLGRGCRSWGHWQRGQAPSLPATSLQFSRR